MPFKQIPCHVWAIDGYLDDARSDQVNAAFVHYCDENILNPAKRPRRIVQSDDAIVKQIVDAVRATVNTQFPNGNVAAVVYGGFRDGNKAPEHMWLEVGGRIYDTMPDYVLFSLPASAATREQPFLEANPFRGAGASVGRYQTQLTVNQQSFIANNDQTAAPHVAMKAGVTIDDAAAAATKIQAIFRGHLVRNPPGN